MGDSGTEGERDIASFKRGAHTHVREEERFLSTSDWRTGKRRKELTNFLSAGSSRPHQGGGPRGGRLGSRQLAQKRGSGGGCRSRGSGRRGYRRWTRRHQDSVGWAAAATGARGIPTAARVLHERRGGCGRWSSHSSLISSVSLHSQRLPAAPTAAAAYFTEPTAVSAAHALISEQQQSGSASRRQRRRVWRRRLVPAELELRGAVQTGQCYSLPCFFLSSSSYCVQCN